ncbi:hypothetical protein MTR67_034970 [Solanum verrucosum]|uniref:Uncharacterized protein n=1 Tax=Solanum verrucosum TaxID=315347 RepID=A0AAF0ZL16_SOLVR|nr:hypothetical protein MTR67_034970 [Solanum verrucosum]
MKKGPILLEKEPFVDDLFSTENCFFPSSNITEMEMGTGVRTEISSAKDDVAIYFGSEVLGEPLPLQINDSLSEQEIEDKASLWVHSNVLKLSQLFGVAFEGCDKVAFDLFLRIDQKRGDLRQKKVETTPIKAKNTIPKEIRNLEFQWDGTFTGIKQSILPRIGSDHSPILLECGDLNLKKSYFKFEQWWLRVEGFSDKVKDWWESFNITGTGSYVLASKLRMLKGKLKEWKRENRNNWNQRKEEILNQLSILEKTQELRLLSEDELLQKVHLSMEFEDVAKNKEIA